MPADESVLLVPLRSNASALLNGAPVAVLRRRLKYASIFFDRLLLETGMFYLHAGPTVSLSVIGDFNEERPHRWQNAAVRHRDENQQFRVTIGLEYEGGKPPTFDTTGPAESAIDWAATLEPFADELPRGADWVEFARVTPESVKFTSAAPLEPVRSFEDLADQWTRADEENLALRQAIPVPFVRDTVIGNVNHDQAYAASSGFDLTIDSFHQRVVTQRFSDETGWRVHGYIVPIIIPEVGRLPWQVIADLRHDRNMVRFRAVLKEVEEEALAEAAGGDIEAAAHHVYERHLERATPVEGISVPVGHTAGGLLISATAGVATSPIAGMGGIIASTLLGTVIGGVLDARSYIRQRKSKGWLTVVMRIRGDRI